jgi:hypothetical protein
MARFKPNNVFNKEEVQVYHLGLFYIKKEFFIYTYIKNNLKLKLKLKLSGLWQN